MDKWPAFAEVSFPVRYAETDAQHVVYYANHLAWFELGYEALLAALGRPLGVDRPPVLEATCRYQAPIRYGETVTVQSRPHTVEGNHLWIAHTVRVGAELRATGSTLLAEVGALCPRLSPQESLERFTGWESWQPHGRREEFPLSVRYAETEPTRGAHFARYFAWLEVGRIAFLHRIGLNYARIEADGSPFVIAWAGCRYFSPVRFDDLLQLEVWIAEVRRRSFVAGYRLRHEGRLVALGRTVQTFIGATGRSTPIPEAAREVLSAAEENRSPAIETPIVLRRLP